MVHLQPIPTDDDLGKGSVVDGLKLDKLQFEPQEDEFVTSVYGSRYAAEDLPKVEMPEREMPKEVAYRMIKDDLSLDGNPMLNLASFVTTYMEDEAEKLMAESLSKNFIDYEEYPQSADIVSDQSIDRSKLLETELTAGLIAKSMRLDGDHVGHAVHEEGTTYQVTLLGYAVDSLQRWQNKRKEEGKPYDKPNIVMSAAVQGECQLCLFVFVRYFEVEEKFVYCTEDRYVIDPEETVNLIDENTIGICAILGTTYTGEYEDVKKVNDLLIERGIECPIHVDAASGGFVAPFVRPELVWDFRLKNVISINVSGHKYGLVYPGVGWIVWRAPEYLPKELVFNINYLGADQASFTLNFSKGASQVIGQYYQMIRLGKRGYRSIMMNLTRTADYLSAALEKLGFIIMSQGGGKGLPLVAFRLNPKSNHHYDEVGTGAPESQAVIMTPFYHSSTRANHSVYLVCGSPPTPRERLDCARLYHGTPFRAVEAHESCREGGFQQEPL
ncbi:hypothetical protein GP486_006994 [Trichoglossum hirsutum]|uniref:Glutamate decarboxylase n=1 Tax=Trichoglossum hirsutum TaxID=265104 RepID=A0A9P8L7P7_9PEZI|nr:hypothetical protein GP486_006994 [Trichoglossum hirsutum]